MTEATLQQLELALVIVDRARIPGLTETARAGLSLLAEVRRLNGEVKRLEAGILPTDFEDTDPGKNGCRCDPDVDYYCDEHAFQREVLRANAAERECERIKAENAALRARALPVLEWKPVENGFWCVVGSTVLNVQKATEEGSFWRWSVGVQPEEDMIDVCENPWRKLFTSPEEAKSACEAAFLRLVGAGS